jgi:rod shape-determining protein MreC
MAAQVIGASGSELSRSVYIDKGEKDHIKPDMAVITADGIVGKVLRVYRSTSQVLLINDQTSGVGALLDKTRLQGILRGTSAGEAVLEKVMSDESVPPGELVLTSGGDGVFPKGLLVGRVTKVSAGNDLFLNIRVRPAADLSKLEEVLVVTKIDERQTEPDQAGAARAVDILAERLPTVPAKAEAAAKDGVATTTALPKAVVPNTVAPNTFAPKAGGALPASNPKPKTVPAQAAAGSAPVANKAAHTTVGVGPASGSPSATSSVNGATTNTNTNDPATTVTPKPEVPSPPQADSQDNPH